jgi:hypothetical protein
MVSVVPATAARVRGQAASGVKETSSMKFPTDELMAALTDSKANLVVV